MKEEYKYKIILYSSNMYCETKNTKLDVLKHNTNFDKLQKVFKQFKKEEDKSLLLELLEHENEKVRLEVAAECLSLNIYIKQAKKVLKKLSKLSGEIGFVAEMTLEVYKEQGYL